MAKQVSVEIEVNSSQIDQTIQKLGQLKDLGKGLKIQYDIDGKPIDIVIDKTLNLGQQVKVLTAELRKTKEGTAEFTLLSTKLNNTKDDLTRVNAKSRELFSTFSLIPGPIGEIFGKLNGVVGLLKTFSGFSLKDIGNQFKGFFNDIKSITDSFYGLNSAQKQNTKLVDEATLATDAATAANLKDNELRKGKSQILNESTVATDAATAAQLKQNDATKEGNVAILNHLNATDNFNAAESRLIATGFELEEGMIETQNGFETMGYYVKDAEGQLTIYSDSLGKTVNALDEEGLAALKASGSVDYLDDITQKSTQTTKVATASYGIMGTALKTLGFEAAAASAAVVVLDTVLAAIGIGIIIAAVVGLISVLSDLTIQFYDWATGATAAKKAMDEVNKTIEKTNELLDLDLKGSKRRNDEYIALLKSRGATEKEVNKATMDGLKERLTLTETALADITKAENKALQDGKVNSEEYKKIEANRTKLDQESKDLRSQIRVKELDDITANNKKISDEKQKSIEESKRLREKEIADNKSADEILLKLLEENAALRQTDKRKREDVELKSAMEAEERSINMLKISEEKKGILLNQIKVKYGLKVLEINTKRNEEDLTKQEQQGQKVADYASKLEDIRIAAIEDANQKEVEQRRNKYSDDLKDLDKALKDKLITQEQYNATTLNLQKGLDNDLKILAEDKKKEELDNNLKKLDDDIRFQEISNEANKNNFQEYFKGRETLLQLSKQRELLEVEAGSEKALLIEKKYASLSKQIQQEKYQAILGFVSQGLSAASNVIAQSQQVSQLAMQNELDAVKGSAEEQDKIKAKYFEKNKKTQIAQAIISTLQSAISAFSSLAVIPVVGPALGAAAAAAALIFGYKQVDQIKKQQYQSSTSASDAAEAAKPAMANYGRNYESGGMIGGRRHAEGGTMIEAEKGEAIMTRGAVTMFAPMLSMMNQMGGGTSFAPSLMTTSYDKPNVSTPSQEQSPIIVKSYVVSSDMTSSQEKNARLKDLSTL